MEGAWHSILDQIKSTSMQVEPATASECGASDESQVWARDGLDDQQVKDAEISFATSKIKLMPEAKAKLYQQHAGSYWDKFYRSNEDRFFLDRHYLHKDFGIDLLPAARQELWLLELGCGTGASVLPLLDKLKHLHVCACDLSRTAIRLLQSAIKSSKTTKRAFGFVADACDPRPSDGLQPIVEASLGGGSRQQAANNSSEMERQPQPATSHEFTQSTSSQEHAESDLPGWVQSRVVDRGGFDSVLMLFMLSAMAPRPALHHARAFSLAARCLRPGGTLLFRDYGQLDAAELRFSPGHQLGDHLFVRRDGTQAYFFGVDETCSLAQEAGLEVMECHLLRRKYLNRGEGKTLRRVFIHGRFRKPRLPLPSESGAAMRLLNAARTAARDRTHARAHIQVHVKGVEPTAVAPIETVDPWDCAAVSHGLTALPCLRDIASRRNGHRYHHPGTAAGEVVQNTQPALTSPDWLSPALAREAETEAACRLSVDERAQGLMADIIAGVRGSSISIGRSLTVRPR